MRQFADPSETVVAAEAEAQDLRDRLLARARRRRAAGPAVRDSAQAATVAFPGAAGGNVTRCPTVHLLPSS